MAFLNGVGILDFVFLTTKLYNLKFSFIVFYILYIVHFVGEEVQALRANQQI